MTDLESLDGAGVQRRLASLGGSKGHAVASLGYSVVRMGTFGKVPKEERLRGQFQIHSSSSLQVYGGRTHHPVGWTPSKKKP